MLVGDAVVVEVVVGDTMGADAAVDTAVDTATGTNDLIVKATQDIGATARYSIRPSAVSMDDPIRPTRNFLVSGIWVRSRCTLTTSSPMHMRRPVEPG